jgi:hypothetical protein
VIGLALLAAVSIAPPSNVPDPLTAAVMQKIANDWAVSDPARLAAANRLILAMDGDSHRKEHVEQAAKSLLYAPLLACVDDAANQPSRSSHCDEVSKESDRADTKLPALLPSLVVQSRNAEQHVYAAHFTADEMDAISRFISSPAGQKFSSEQRGVRSEIGVMTLDLLSSALRPLLPSATPAIPASPSTPQDHRP